MEEKSLDNGSSNQIAIPVTHHRTCWIHTIAFLHCHGIKMRKQEFERMKLASPCFLHPNVYSFRKRSKRIRKHKNAIPKEIRENGKMNSGEFDTYFEHLWESFAEEKKVSFTYFGSLWFNLYTKINWKAKVLTWIKRKEIFSKKYVLVPIVHWGHWRLLIFCHLGENFQSKAKTPCILLLDSLEQANPKRIEPEIRKFLLDIYRSEGRAENQKLMSRIPFLLPKVPQQRSDVDCGSYVLYFIKLFVQLAPDNFSIDGYPYFMNQNWFTPECLECFFEELDSSTSRKTFFEEMKSINGYEL